ncbi:glycosyltransferase [Gemella sp. GH3]|uniref:glycosyltransferase n=1 Tax=unclassified Gemella TaxID=2624949 RepID=UPI0015CFBBD5|nr:MULTISPECIES: glycosyltransferase [unclassified Gemella]MBF0713645.1 glycosyltransferase [Gemella sp. GH3.1]NYS50597.1 glycosyltransferase [Gemella sp. GH3]
MRKKVLIAIPSFSSGGGAEKILSNILMNGNFDDYDIDIVEMFRGDKGLENLPKGINVINYYNSYKYNKFVSLFLDQFGKYFPSFLRKYLVKKDDYDVEIYFEIMYPDMPFTKRDIKKISWIHGSIEEFGLDEYAWRKKRYREYLRNSNYIVAISQKTKKSITDIYPEFKDKVSLIYNGYNFDNIYKLSQDSRREYINKNSICSIGRIEKEKGSDKLLDVLLRIHSKGYKYHLYYIGTGTQEELLKSKVLNLNLQKYVHFLGYQKNPYKYLIDMKCLVSMSEKEGFPGVIVESLTLGVPFVFTNVGGVEELSSNGRYGKIICNEEEAADSIIKYVENIEGIDKEETRLFINQFDLQEQARKFKEIIEY